MKCDCVKKKFVKPIDKCDNVNYYSDTVTNKEAIE